MAIGFVVNLCRKRSQRDTSITLDMKQTGKRSAGKPHAAFDVAGAGDVTMTAGLRTRAKAMELPPTPNVRAPALDPTLEGRTAETPPAYSTRSWTRRQSNRMPSQ